MTLDHLVNHKAIHLPPLQASPFFDFIFSHCLFQNSQDYSSFPGHSHLHAFKVLTAWSTFPLWPNQGSIIEQEASSCILTQASLDLWRKSEPCLVLPDVQTPGKVLSPQSHWAAYPRGLLASPSDHKLILALNITSSSGREVHE